MTEQDKQLLLKDLCARLPYGVKVNEGDVIIESLHNICKVGDNEYNINTLFDDKYTGFSVDDVKPYLRPVSNMTEEERKEYTEWLPDGYNIDTFDWLNAHHFDYRGLIPMGLAIDCTNLNIY